MSPFLEREGLPDNRDYKFVRERDRLAYQHAGEFGMTQHKDIAKSHGLDNPDDAGLITQDSGTVYIHGFSPSLGLGDDKRQRSKTAKLIKKKTGLKVDSF